jgi:hypothetical protein
VPDYLENFRGFRVSNLDILSNIFNRDSLLIFLDILLYVWECILSKFLEVSKYFCTDFVGRVTENYFGIWSEFPGENPLFCSEFSLCGVSISFLLFAVKYVDSFSYESIWLITIFLRALAVKLIDIFWSFTVNVFHKLSYSSGDLSPCFSGVIRWVVSTFIRCYVVSYLDLFRVLCGELFRCFSGVARWVISFFFGCSTENFAIIFSRLRKDTFWCLERLTTDILRICVAFRHQLFRHFLVSYVDIMVHTYSLQPGLLVNITIMYLPFPDYVTYNRTASARSTFRVKISSFSANIIRLFTPFPRSKFHVNLRPVQWTQHT